MGRLFNMLTRVAVWGAAVAAVGYIGTMVYEMAFASGVLGWASANAMKGATVGAIVGGVIGFFRRN